MRVDGAGAGQLRQLAAERRRRAGTKRKAESRSLPSREMFQYQLFIDDSFRLAYNAVPTFKFPHVEETRKDPISILFNVDLTRKRRQTSASGDQRM